MLPGALAIRLLGFAAHASFVVATAAASEVNFANGYKQHRAAEQRVKENPSNNNQKPKPSQTEVDREWRMVCRQASILIREQCTTTKCQTEMVRGNLLKRCAKTPQDDKQCNDVLNPLVELCGTEQCRQGLEALKSKECVGRKDPAAESNNGTVTESDVNGDMAPMTRSEWETRCNKIARTIIQSCEAKKKCIDNFKSTRLWTNCDKDRPKSKNDCKALFSGKLSACPSTECISKVTDLEDKACAGNTPK
ncbi:hypothetical protein QQS21_011247 [Conoideocrella luteorostrata]|uniref:Uncharacterized protein n=1 Tax=Conoideocrella luteorostrata TaxID=1105319 RepID=A0AAJ0FNK3_9HYPO|nr:hypothetical protein QQS21_011247 [Conoideocrella luteorostrata]